MKTSKKEKGCKVISFKEYIFDRGNAQFDTKSYLMERAAVAECCSKHLCGPTPYMIIDMDLCT